MFVLMLGLFLSVGAFAQIDVKGHVKDAQGEPIIGATVRVANTQIATVTDFDGNFALKANQGADITISYIGYQSQTVKAAPNLEITLQDDQALLNEVVVIGYGVARKNDLTGSVTAMKPDEKNHGMITTAQDMIQGKIAGVNVTTGSGAPGTGATIRIRGGSSFNDSGNDPLIVIDGLAMDNQGVKGLPNPLSMVNPNDIESFTVLKDASATAIYGSRGSNGVIIITTKKGRKGQKPSITYNGSVSYSFKTKDFKVLGADEYRDFIRSYYGIGSDADALLGQANTDWQDEIFRHAFGTDHNVTIAGGFKNMPYRFSIGYTNQDGILSGSHFERSTASLTLNPSFFDDHLKFQLTEMIVQNYNHPSIFCWGLWNEINGDFNAIAGQLNDLAHQLDPVRLTTLATCNEGTFNFTADLVGWNKYFGWYEGAVSGFAPFFDNWHKTYPDAKICVSEYGAGAAFSIHASQVDDTPTKPQDSRGHYHPMEKQTFSHRLHLQMITERDYLWGSYVWNMFDFASAMRREGDTNNLNDKGLVSQDRQRRKDAFYLYKANWNKKEATVHLCSKEYTQRKEDVTDIIAFTTAPQVKLFLNGKQIGTQKTDAYATVEFKNVKLQKGENKVEIRTPQGNDNAVWFVE